MRHAPYDRMDRSAVEFLVERLSLAYYAKGEIVTAPDRGVATRLYVIQRGRVRGDVPGELAEDAGSAKVRDVVDYSVGDTFPLAAIVARRPVRHSYVAAEDTFCYEADAAVVDSLMRLSPEFHAFCTSRVSTLLQQSYALLQEQYSRRSSAQQSLSMTLGQIVRRTTLQCASHHPLREALTEMHSARVGSIVIVDDAGFPTGIFTERDLLRLAAEGRFEPGKAIGEFMTSRPRTLPTSASAAEAAVLMVKAGIRHVVVVEAGRLVGVVSERDLFSLQRTGMRDIIQALERAESIDHLVQAATDIRMLAANFIAQGVAGGHLIELITSMNDRLSVRLLDIVAARHDLSGIRVTWIALGSEGRHEQTLATDQDNAILFDAPDRPVSEVRAALVAFGKSVNEGLDRCGFPLCKGGIMAGNPQWCLEMSEWKSLFGNWLRNPQPEALLNASIFFDFRSLWGAEELAKELRAWLAQELKGATNFLHAMAANALRSGPPLGLIADFATSGEGDEANTIDLKAGGTRPFVDAARILALASGIDSTGTIQRLRLAGEKLRTPASEIEAMIEGFQFIQLMRLRHQQQRGDGPGNPNRIDPDRLNGLERRVLKEAFRQARKLQHRIAMDYRL